MPAPAAFRSAPGASDGIADTTSTLKGMPVAPEAPPPPSSRGSAPPARGPADEPLPLSHSTRTLVAKAPPKSIGKDPDKDEPSVVVKKESEPPLPVAAKPPPNPAPKPVAKPVPKDETSRPAPAATLRTDDDVDDVEERKPISKGRPQVEEKPWTAKGAAKPEPNRVDGRKLVTWIMIAAALLTVGLIYARYVVRGEHDTAEGLAVKPTATATATTTSTTTVTTATPSPSHTTAPPASTAIATASASASAMTSAVASTSASASVAPPASGAPSDTVVAAKSARPPVQRPADESTGPPSPMSLVDKDAGAKMMAGSYTEAAQKALERPGSAVEAKNLAWQATRSDPTNADAWLTLAAAYDAIGNRQAAINAYKSCVQQASAHPHVGRCRSLAGQ